MGYNNFSLTQKVSFEIKKKEGFVSCFVLLFHKTTNNSMENSKKRKTHHEDPAALLAKNDLNAAIATFTSVIVSFFVSCSIWCLNKRD